MVRRPYKISACESHSATGATRLGGLLLAKFLQPVSARRPLLQASLMYFLRKSPWNIICILAAGCSQFRSYRGRRKSIIRFFEGNWASKFAFMPFLGFSSTWRTADISRADFSLGRHVIEQLLGLPVDRREISFLVSEEALDRCSSRGVISAPRGAEALKEYKRALEVTAARKAAIHRVVPAGGSNIQFTQSGKSQAVPIVAPSSSKKRSRASVFKPSLSASRICSKALAGLNSEVFPRTPINPPIDEDTSKAVRSLQGDVLQVASQLFHLKGRMKDRSVTKAERDALAIRLREENDAILAKDEQIEACKLRVQDLDEERERLEADDVFLRRQLEDKEEEICELRYAAEVFYAGKIKAVNDAKVVVRWELMQERLDDQTDCWDPITSFEQYKVLTISEAELLGLPPPSVEYKP
uniref:Uncharacterized protein n=1 Tax=Brassica campestris TaxID=3711 RepID=M4FEQ9_BRACM